MNKKEQQQNKQRQKSKNFNKLLIGNSAKNTKTISTIVGKARSYRFFRRIDFFLLANPILSTVVTASVLASFWLLTWLAVLFFITLSTKSSTSAHIFLAGLILSTVAEAIIRCVETSYLIERWGRGTLHKEMNEVTLAWGIAYLFAGLFFVSILPDLIHIPPETSKLKGVGTFSIGVPDNNRIPIMYNNWKAQFYGSPIMMKSLMICWILRVVIYKRPSRTLTWREAREHIDEYTAGGIKNE